MRKQTARIANKRNEKRTFFAFRPPRLPSSPAIAPALAGSPDWERLTTLVRFASTSIPSCSTIDFKRDPGWSKVSVAEKIKS